MLIGNHAKYIFDLSFIVNIFSLIRAKHWLKNGFVFLPIFLSNTYSDLDAIGLSVVTFISFSLAASAIYVINDIVDIQKDRNHPLKMNRALASGKISIPQAICIEFTVIGSALYFLNFLPVESFGVIIIYFVLNLIYSIALKHVVFIDVLIIATGFVLRVAAGAFAINWDVPLWLILVTFFLCLFLALGKRRHELLYTDKNGGVEHRPVLAKYNEKLLDCLIIVSATLALASYSLFVMDVYPVIFSFPFILYGMFRYLHIVYMQNAGGDPSTSVTKDKPLIISVVFWLILVYAALLFTK